MAAGKVSGGQSSNVEPCREAQGPGPAVPPLPRRAVPAPRLAGVGLMYFSPSAPFYPST